MVAVKCYALYAVDTQGKKLIATFTLRRNAVKFAHAESTPSWHIEEITLYM